MSIKKSQKRKDPPNFVELIISRLNSTSASSLFRTVILTLTLIVAAIAILAKVFEPVVWSFLSVIAGYAALSNNRQDSFKHRK